jgi:hypothetical protein
MVDLRNSRFILNFLIASVIRNFCWKNGGRSRLPLHGNLKWNSLSKLTGEHTFLYFWPERPRGKKQTT